MNTQILVETGVLRYSVSFFLSMLDPDVACYRICPSNAIPEVHERIAAAGGVVGQGRASFGLLDGINRAFGLDFTASM